MNELLKKVYPKDLEQTYSRYAGEKTTLVTISSLQKGMSILYPVHVFRKFVIEHLKAKDSYLRNI